MLSWWDQQINDSIFNRPVVCLQWMLFQLVSCILSYICTSCVIMRCPENLALFCHDTALHWTSLGTRHCRFVMSRESKESWSTAGWLRMRKLWTGQNSQSYHWTFVVDRSRPNSFLDQISPPTINFGSVMSSAHLTSTALVNIHGRSDGGFSP